MLQDIYSEFIPVNETSNVSLMRFITVGVAYIGVAIYSGTLGPSVTAD